MKVNGGTMQADSVIRNGLVIDGSGRPGQVQDIAIRRGRIVGLGDQLWRGREEIDATGHVVCPGFINVRSRAAKGLLYDGRGLCDVSQGITLEILEDRMAGNGDAGNSPDGKPGGRHDLLSRLEKQGVVPNVATFLSLPPCRPGVTGIGQKRTMAAGERAATLAGVEAAMRNGAFGICTGPDTAVALEDLIGLARAIAARNGLYAVCLQGDMACLSQTLDDVETVLRQSGCAGHIHHLRAFDRYPVIVERIAGMRRDGLQITADTVPYISDYFDLGALLHRGVDMSGNNSDPLSHPEGVVFVHVDRPELSWMVGRTLADVVTRYRQDSDRPTGTLDDAERTARVICRFTSPGNLRCMLALPWVAIGTDADTPWPDARKGTHPVHPRAYGAFPRTLRLARERQLSPLEAIINKMTGLPAGILGLRHRGRLAIGAWADIVIFDPHTVSDRATYGLAHRHAAGIRDVLVNGVPVWRSGAYTGYRPGHAIRGPGFDDRHAAYRHEAGS